MEIKATLVATEDRHFRKKGWKTDATPNDKGLWVDPNGNVIAYVGREKEAGLRVVWKSPRPCREFGTLQRWLKKKGLEIQPTDLWRARLEGKGGEIRGIDESTKGYICEHPQACKDILRLLKMWTYRKRNVKFFLKEIDNISEEEREISKHNYNWFFGTRERCVCADVKIRSGAILTYNTEQIARSFVL